MAKYTSRFKLKIVRQFLAGPLGGRLLARQHGLPYSMVYRWVARFRAHGPAGLAASHGCYDAAFRLRVVRRIKRDDLSYTEAATLFGVGNPSTIARWEQRYHAGGLPALRRSQAPRDHDQARRPRRTDRSPTRRRDADGGSPAGRKRAASRRAGTAPVFQRLRSLQKKSADEKAKAVQALRHAYPLQRLLEAVDLSRSTFYHRRNLWAAADPLAWLKTAIRHITDKDANYGYRRVTDHLRGEGHKINHKLVQRVMQMLGLQVLCQPKKYRSYRGPGHVDIPNVLQRNFSAPGPNQRWVTDVTEFAVGGEKCYLSPILDLYNGEIIAFELARRPTLALVKSMVKKAAKRLGAVETPLLHSDQGWQYQHASYRRLLSQKNLTQSMSAKGNCLDNAAMESFFGLIKNELFYRNRFESIDQLQAAIRRYIRYYNHDRIKRKLNGLSPVKYRTQAACA